MNEQRTLPPGYSIQQDACKKLFFVQKGGTILRRTDKQPIAYKEQVHAIGFAWWHSGEEAKMSHYD